VGGTPYLEFSATPKLRDPKKHHYPAVPENWQTQEELEKKPSLQRAAKDTFGFLTGGISENESEIDFTAAPTGFDEEEEDDVDYTQKVLAPYSYWQRAMDMYTQVMSGVDVHIGTVLSQIPTSLMEDTVIIFTSDHGDYASSHGMQGKGQTAYRESYNVPLIVKELGSSPQLTGDTDVIRKQLCSSIDLVPMLVSLGNNSNMDWVTDTAYKAEFQTDLLYGGDKRFDLLSIVKDASAAGRSYATFTCDELMPNNMNPVITDGGMGDGKRAPTHVIGCIFDQCLYEYQGVEYEFNGKLALYFDWKDWEKGGNVSEQMVVDETSLQLEYYNYLTGNSLMEMTMNNDDEGSPMDAMVSFVLDKLIPEEIQGTMPPSLEAARYESVAQYWAILHAANSGSETSKEASNYILSSHFVN
jgi:uncharacterized sulfatase